VATSVLCKNQNLLHQSRAGQWSDWEQRRDRL